MAEGIMRHLEPQFTVDSAGTSNYHIGQAPDRRMIHTAQSYGIDLSQLKARQLTSDDFDHFDAIYVMDKSNYKKRAKLSKNRRPQTQVTLHPREQQRRTRPLLRRQ